VPQIRNLRAPLSPRFTLIGVDTRPDGLDWADATDAERRRYYRILAKHVRQEMDAQLAAGLDWQGADLVPIRLRTWQERMRKYTVWTGPPLTPQYEGSRTRKLFQVAATKDRVVGYWSRRWGKAIKGHCLGARNLPKRDVCGLTDQGLAGCYRKAVAEWRRARAPGPFRRIGDLPVVRRKDRPEPPVGLDALTNRIEDLYGEWLEKSLGGASQEELDAILARIAELQAREVEYLASPWRKRGRRDERQRLIDERLRYLAEAKDVKVTRYRRKAGPDGRRLIASFSIE
jgi:hypothetical protein